MRLLIQSNNPTNPQTLDLTQFIDVQDGQGMDPYDPAFSEKVISHSLLKEGGFLALESLQAKELAFPLKLNAVSSPAVALLIQQINQIVTTAGATASWQDDGVSQPTIFDLLSGQFDIAYRYREAQRFWTSGKLRLFSAPLGHAPGPRAYAAASGVGPLLLISPGQASSAGRPVSYVGNPSLAGDAGALLQISYVGPAPTIAGGSNAKTGVVPYTAVSVLPDSSYPVLTPAASAYAGGVAGVVQTAADGVASQFVRMYNTTRASLQLPRIASSIPAQWAGNHRILAIARASGSPESMQLIGDALVPYSVTASVYPADWQLIDLGTLALRASETPLIVPQVVWNGAPASQPVDVTAFIMLPEATTWFFNPTSLNPSQYGGPAAVLGGPNISAAPYTNTLLLDDTLADQFIYSGSQQTFAPSPIGMTASSARITQYTRGLPPRPEPKNGVPVIAIVGVGQPYAASSYLGASVAWANPQSLGTMAQVSVLERTRYILP